jgi:uncharacterized protein YuzB (UPF0349 family)
MKTVISVVVALALTLSIVPAMAGDTFQAFSQLSAGEQKILAPLTDEQLDVIEGEGSSFCYFCSNYAAIYQANVNYGNRTRQANVAVVKQEIN